MKIYAIPINEVLEQHECCAFCKMEEFLENRSIEYILGSAMMEPDIRVETNKMGFCEKHLDLMFASKNKLAFSLLISTRLQYILDHNVSKPRKLKGGSPSLCDCYVCNNVIDSRDKMIANFLKLYASGEDGVKTLFDNQKMLCFKHANLLSTLAPKHMPKKSVEPFLKLVSTISTNHAQQLIDDINAFTASYNYQNTSEPLTEDAKNSPRNTVKFIQSIPKI